MNRILTKNKKSIHINYYTTHSHPFRYNYTPDYFSEQEPEELKQVIKQFTVKHSSSHQSSLKLYHHKQLATFHHPPRPSISLSRDFIHDCLYNPHYGYFFNQVEILDSSHPSTSLDRSSHHPHPPPRYLDHQQKLLVVNRHQSPPDTFTSIPPDSNLDERQIWHTPSELFKPWYAWSIANVIVGNHLKQSSESKKLKPLYIYEIGAGNGTLCCGILDYVQKNHPELYSMTNYVTIELSTRLAEKQRQKIEESGHSNQAKVINQSILSLSDSSSSPFTPTLEPCWILGMEVLDNLSRDVIRRDPITLQPFQSIVITDLNGDFHERFIPITKANNPNLSDYLSMIESNDQNRSSNKSNQPNKLKTLIKKLMVKYIPFHSNLTQYEFIPTNYLILIQNLFKFFPNHKLILSDFFHLNNSLINNNLSILNSSWWLKKKQNNRGAPVVQTRYNGMTIPVSTYLVKPGLFDIFFPTDFDELIQIYKSVFKQYNHQSIKSIPIIKNYDNDHNYNDSKENKPKDMIDKKIHLINQNKFLYDYLRSSNFKKSLNNFNNLTDHNNSDHDSDASNQNSMSMQIQKKHKDYSLDSSLVFNYYQNVQVLIIN